MLQYCTEKTTHCFSEREIQTAPYALTGIDPSVAMGIPTLSLTTSSTEDNYQQLLV